MGFFEMDVIREISEELGESKMADGQMTPDDVQLALVDLEPNWHL